MGVGGDDGDLNRCGQEDDNGARSPSLSFFTVVVVVLAVTITVFFDFLWYFRHSNWKEDSFLTVSSPIPSYLLLKLIKGDEDPSVVRAVVDFSRDGTNIFDDTFLFFVGLPLLVLVVPLNDTRRCCLCWCDDEEVDEDTDADDDHGSVEDELLLNIFKRSSNFLMMLGVVFIFVSRRFFDRAGGGFFRTLLSFGHIFAIICSANKILSLVPPVTSAGDDKEDNDFAATGDDKDDSSCRSPSDEISLLLLTIVFSIVADGVGVEVGGGGGGGTTVDGEVKECRLNEDIIGDDTTF